MEIAFSTASVALNPDLLCIVINSDCIGTVTDEVLIGILLKIGEGLAVRLMTNG